MNGHWLKRIWHNLRHNDQYDSLVERAPGEIYLRCQKCGLKSPVWRTGPLRVRSRLPGNPAHFRITAVGTGAAFVAVPRHAETIDTTVVH